MTGQGRRLEVCVDTYEGLQRACDGGADRIELCAALSEGGPNPLRRPDPRRRPEDDTVLRHDPPRAGGFQYTQHEIDIMRHDIDVVKAHDLAGIVIGAETEDATLDLRALRLLVEAAEGLGVTLHRVIDCVTDPLKALDAAVDLGIERVLTSGGAVRALDGAAQIRRMVAHVGPDMCIMPGSGITAANVQQIAKATGAVEFHSSCSVKPPRPTQHMFASASGAETSQRAVEDMKRALAG